MVTHRYDFLNGLRLNRRPLSFAEDPATGNIYSDRKIRVRNHYYTDGSLCERVKYAYDLIGNVVGREAIIQNHGGPPGGLLLARTAYTYDALDRPLQVRDQGGEVFLKAVRFQYQGPHLEYLNRHNSDVVSEGTKVSATHYDYLTDGRLETIRHDAGGVEVAAYGLTYDTAL